MSAKGTRKHKEDKTSRYEAFFAAIKLGDRRRLQQILKQTRIDLNTRDPRDPLRRSGLSIATDLNDITMVRLLLCGARGRIDVNTEDDMGKRPIGVAVENDCEEIARALLERSCEINYRNSKTGCSPLHVAVTNDNTKMAKLLIRYGADVNLHQLKHNVSLETPLMRAVQLNHSEMCDTLIKASCDVNAGTSNNITALHYAVAYRRYDACQRLLENGAKVQVSSNNGVTALTIAIDQHNPTMVKTLANFGYNLNCPYHWEECPLEHAVRLHGENCAMALVHGGCALKTIPGKPSYFYQAVSAGLVRLAKLILAVRPMHHQDDWIRLKKWPLALYYKPRFCDWLLKKAKKPTSLKASCRAKILLLVGLRPHIKIETLHLPVTLKHYLQLKNYIKDSLYRLPRLDRPDCPYNCPVLCEEPICPPLDIHSDENS